MIQIMNPKIEPINDIIVSNEGIKIATMTMMVVRAILIVMRIIARLNVDRPARGEGDATFRPSRPSNLSAELIIGREFKGILVMGMTVMKTTIMIERVRG